MDIGSIVSAIATPAATAAVAGYLGREIVKAWLGRDLERYRAELQRASTEHQIRFLSLHEHQAEIIAEVFGKLEVTHQAFLRWASPVTIGGAPDMLNLRQEALGAYNEFVEYYHPKAIWLDPETCTQINAIVTELRGVFFDLGGLIDANGYPQDREAWRTAQASLRTEIPKARGLLDARFRKILAVDERGAQTARS